MIVHLCKTALTATLALFFLVVALDNIIDYSANQVFVQHVLAMDTIEPRSPLMWRAVTDSRLVTLAYDLIIAWQAATAVMLCYAVIRLGAACGDRQRFTSAKPVALLGLTFGLLLYGLGFTVIGGEWFAMWQSQTWNGLEGAARFILLDGLVLVFIAMPEV